VHDETGTWRTGLRCGRRARRTVEGRIIRPRPTSQGTASRVRTTVPAQRANDTSLLCPVASTHHSRAVTVSLYLHCPCSNQRTWIQCIVYDTSEILHSMMTTAVQILGGFFFTVTVSATFAHSFRVVQVRLPWHTGWIEKNPRSTRHAQLRNDLRHC
jgi:hypothetical protein